MPTENERKALWFLALVALSGSGVRLWRAQARPVDAPAAMALERQLARADSARAIGGERGSGRRAEPGSRRGTSQSAGRGTSARRDRGGPMGPPPTTPAVPPPPPAGTPDALVDLDRADSATLEALPGIGPALAARIVAHRDSAGSFGHLDALCEVRGIGPALAKKLRPLVTFTGPRRPLSDACGGGSGPSRRSSAARRRKPG